MSINIKNLEATLKSLVYHLGLHEWRLEIIQDATKHGQVFAHLSRTIEIPPLTSENMSIEAIVDPILEPIMKSEFIISEKAKLTAECKKMHEDLSVMVKRCEDLEQYKQHFKLAFLMTQGKLPDLVMT